MCSRARRGLSVGAGLIPRVVMALGSEVNDNSSKNASQKVKKCPASSKVTVSSGNDNVNKGKL